MLENTLHWSLSQMNGLRPALRPTDVSAIIQEQIGLLQPVVDAKHISISPDLTADTFLLADENHLAIIFRNLLQNALKFTNLGGRIRVSHTTEAGLQRIAISDTGVGMTSAQLDSLFRVQNQSSQPGTANEAGTGLGLVLVKELTETNGGTVSVRSDVGKGTTFTLTFAQPIERSSLLAIR